MSPTHWLGLDLWPLWQVINIEHYKIIMTNTEKLLQTILWWRIWTLIYLGNLTKLWEITASFELHLPQVYSSSSSWKIKPRWVLSFCVKIHLISQMASCILWNWGPQLQDWVRSRANFFIASCYCSEGDYRPIQVLVYIWTFCRKKDFPQRARTSNRVNHWNLAWTERAVTIALILFHLITPVQQNLKMRNF